MDSNVDGADLYIGEVASRIIPCTGVLGITADTLSFMIEGK